MQMKRVKEKALGKEAYTELAKELPAEIDARIRQTASKGIDLILTLIRSLEMDGISRIELAILINNTLANINLNSMRAYARKGALGEATKLLAQEMLNWIAELERGESNVV